MSDVQFEIMPWHMWGNSTLVTTNLGAQTQGNPSVQLARINYGRPETWRFFYGIRFPTGTPGGHYTIRFKMMLGVGRSIFTMGTPGDNLMVFALETFGPGAIAPNNGIWRTGVQALDITGNPLAAPIVQEYIVAQDIQVWGEYASDTNGVPIELTFFLAPNVHIRPDWFAGELHGKGGT